MSNFTCKFYTNVPEEEFMPEFHKKFSTVLHEIFKEDVNVKYVEVLPVWLLKLHCIFYCMCRSSQRSTFP